MKSNSKTILLVVTLCLFTMVASFGEIIRSNIQLPRAGLIAHWPGNGNARDVAGGHDGVLANGATYSPGVFGRAFDLDNGAGIAGNLGSVSFPPPAFDNGAFVSVPDSDAWAFGNKDFTIELWANFNALPVNDIGHSQGGVFISNDEGPYDVNKWFFALGGGVLDFHINNPKLGGVFLVQAPFTPDLNQWYHVAITRKKNLYTIYVNGVAVGSEMNRRPVPNADAPLNIGEAEGYYFNGLLDEIGIYNRALSPIEIKSIYQLPFHFHPTAGRIHSL